ncbi:polyprenyl synthetase [Halorubrum sp. GN11_10-6_MGM]|uniref:polyprenyl synthetase n=1 Tax=Halorubrum sp. GN11_10-6_MGM TaxID=2518112 RepID=UPI0010F90CD3|nr:polyprenyl synthetase [Halorubrum sp. GN11_10-6_MGM]TKX73453.1 polyprenyl synthetase [Halorubrum sp. GN11_10-6_MGM]
MSDIEPVHRSQIERHFEQVLSTPDEANLPLVQDVLDDSPDRWYGQVVVTVYDSLSDHQDREAVLPYAAAVELLRGYVRLRNRLLLTLTDKHAHSITLDPTAALLGGDYLYTAAFSSLHSGPDSSSGDCFEILTTALETITEAFARTYTAAGSTGHDQAKFLDDTAGSLGEGAAALGATLAGVDEPVRRHCERLGRGLSTARQINYVLDTDPTEAMVVPPTFDESQFRRYAEQRRDDAAQALNTLSETVDVTPLQAFAEGTVTRHDQQSSATNDDALD